MPGSQTGWLEGKVPNTKRRPAIDKVIVTTLLVIAGVASAVLVANAVLPTITRSSSAIVQVAERMDERLETQISIVFATGELNASGVWQDTNGDGHFDIFAWVKNVGSSRILGIDQMDVFLGKTGVFTRIPYVDDAGGSYPRWTYAIENGTEWTNTMTIKITIHYSSTQASDTYLIKVITPSGAYAEKYFSF